MYAANIADEKSTQAEPIAQTLSHMIVLNERYSVLLRLINKCL
jgi:hypothetical protein